jgi:hypothetical protein
MYWATPKNDAPVYLLFNYSATTPTGRPESSPRSPKKPVARVKRLRLAIELMPGGTGSIALFPGLCAESFSAEGRVSRAGTCAFGLILTCSEGQRKS